MKTIPVFILGLFLIASNVFAAGDLIVEGNVGIGTTAPVSKFEVVLEGAGAAGSFTKYINGVSGAFPMIKKARGTAAAPLSVISNDTIGGFSYQAYDGANWDNAAAIRAVVAGVSAGNVSSYIRVDTANSSGVLTEALRITETQNIGIGTTNPGTYKLYVNGNVYVNGTVTQTSDIRYKENITTIQSPLDKILNMRGVLYSWKTEEYKDKGFSEGKHYGVIGQEVEKVLPDIVKEGEQGEKGVSYIEIIPVLIEAVKEQQRVIEELKAMVKQLERKDLIARSQ